MHRDFVLNPITALAFYTSKADGRRYLLVGEDNRLNLYDFETSSLCGEFDVFPAQSVHGIAVTADDGVNQRILVWGGFSVVVLPNNLVEDVISGGSSKNPQGLPLLVAKASDWIFGGVVSPHGTHELALLTAHNDLIRARFDANDGSIEFLEELSPSRPILYSGNISWEEPDCILVAAGTVFGEIVVWKYEIASQQQQSRCEVLFVFSGHEGSIFGVHISPIITLETGESLRLLASCSDDRTIRIWDITDARDLSSQTSDEYRKKIQAVRETGFGDSIESASLEETSARCLAVAMGHISRIWQVEFPRRPSSIHGSSSIEIWSFGEDATAQRWSLALSSTDPRNNPKSIQSTDLPTRTRGQMKSEAIFANHSGKNIWSHAITNDETGQLVVVTGASDGKISIIGNSQRIASEQTLHEIPPMSVTTAAEVGTNAQDLAITNGSDGTGSTPEALNGVVDATGEGNKVSGKAPKPKKQKVKKPVRDYFNRYALLTDSSILTSTKNGRFLVGNASRNSPWEEVFLPDEFRDKCSTYAVVKGSFNSSTAFVGTDEGDLFSYSTADPTRLNHLARVHGKVSDIFRLSNASVDPTTPNEAKVLVTVLGSETASLLEFDSSSVTEQPRQIDIPLDKRFLVTSAALHENSIILGSRTGFIIVLEAAEGGTYKQQALVEPRTNDCITSISILPPKGGEGILQFLTTCRDGKFRIYTTHKTHDSLSITLIHETSPPFGPIIEGAWFSSNDDKSIDLILFGFRSTKFVVWNETQRKEIAAIEVGGGHRTFVYDPTPGNSDAFRLVWTQASQLHFFSQTHAPHRALKAGGHGREIKAVSSSGALMATAAEDTAIRIWSYRDETEKTQTPLRCLGALENHTAGIQSMKWYNQSHLFSSGGNKEFFIWRISHLDSAYEGLAVKCEAVYPDRADDIDLRIMDFDVHCANGASDDEPSFVISMILSNSALLTYTYSALAGFGLIARGSYTGACMTQLQQLHVDDTTIQTMTAATDGYITIWEAKVPAAGDSSVGEYANLLITKLHQSTMKSLDMRVIPALIGTSYLIATGGDDNAFGVTHLLRDNSSGSVTIRTKSIIRSAHGAAVTGIGILGFTAGERDAVVVSCSNDQRVKRWQVVDWQSEEVKVKLLDNHYSAIADTGDLEILKEGTRFVVGGVGLEVWEIEG
ncbi:hypothetical protein TruAng_009549 [Truncatella angustata]|nr:hypothetical protein TruAng_009549 [Truncatella angustata]